MKARGSPRWAPSRSRQRSTAVSIHGTTREMSPKSRSPPVRRLCTCMPTCVRRVSRRMDAGRNQTVAKPAAIPAGPSSLVRERRRTPPFSHRHCVVTPRCTTKSCLPSGRASRRSTRAEPGKRRTHREPGPATLPLGGLGAFAASTVFSPPVYAHRHALHRVFRPQPLACVVTVRVERERDRAGVEDHGRYSHWRGERDAYSRTREVVLRWETRGTAGRASPGSC